MSTRNIKLGTTTYTGVDTLKVRDADVLEDTYIDFKEAGFPLTLTDSYNPTATDVGKFLVSGSGSSEQMYRVAQMQTEDEVAKTAGGLEYTESSCLTNNNYQLAKLNGSVIAICARFGYEDSLEYKFTMDGGASWSNHNSTTGVDSSVWSEMSYLKTFVIGDKIILHNSQQGQSLYYSTNAKDFTKIDLSSKGVGSYSQFYGNIGASLFFQGTYEGSSYTVVEYNMTSGVATTYTLPDLEDGWYDWRVVSGGKFCRLVYTNNMQPEDPMWRLKTTTDFNTWTTIETPSEYWWDEVDAGEPMIPVYSATSDNYVGVLFSMGSYSTKIVVMNITTGQFYNSYESNSGENDRMTFKSFYIGTTYVFSSQGAPGTYGIESPDDTDLAIQYQSSSSSSWYPLIGGGTSGPGYYYYAAGGLQGDENGFMFLQLSNAYEDNSPYIGVFEHKPYLLRPLSY